VFTTRRPLLGLLLCMFASRAVAPLPVTAAETSDDDAVAPADDETPSQPAERPWKFELKGYGLSLWSHVGPVPGSPVVGTLGTNRLRLETDTRYRRRLNLKVIADLELYAGAVVRSPYWSLAPEPQDGSYWDLDGGEQRGNSTYTRQSLHRVYMTWEAPGLRLDVGKQRIAWGVMRFWRPTDFFNAESPLQIETGERTGIDALRCKVPLGGDDDIDAVFAPSHLDGAEQSAGRYHFVVGDYDLSVVAGDPGGTDVAGVTFDGYVGDGGLRGEVLRVDDGMRDPYWMFAIGGDYAFPRDLTLTLEYLNNGGAAPLGLASPLAAYEGPLRTANRQLVGLNAQLRSTPLLTWSLFVSYDMDGKSAAPFPRLTWDFRQDHELSAGLALFVGSEGGEYGTSPTTFFVQAKRFF